MAAISSTVGVQAATQAAMQQLKVQQVKQNAERAEFAARALRAQANQAQQVADRAQEEARSLYVRSDQAQNAAGQARQGLAMLKSVGIIETTLTNIASQASERQAQIQQSSVPTPVVNTSGQVTGTVIDTVA